MVAAKFFFVFLFSVAFVLTCDGMSVSVRQEEMEEEEPETTMVPEPVAIFTADTVKLGSSFKINCAGDSFGEFTRDYYQWAEGGTSSHYSETSLVEGDDMVPAFVFHSHRYGLYPDPWSYVLPLENPGTYSCTLYFGEIYPDYQKIGARIFSVTAFGSGAQLTEADIDVFAETGGDLTKYAKREFTIEASDSITFQFIASVAEAMVSAIACDIVPIAPIF